MWDARDDDAAAAHGTAPTGTQFERRIGADDTFLASPGEQAPEQAAGAAAGPGGVQALAGALDDQLALELVDRAEDVEGQPPGRRDGVDLLLQDDQADAALAQLVGEREEVLERATAWRGTAG